MSRIADGFSIALLTAALLAGTSTPALAQSEQPQTEASETDQARMIADLQRQIDELKAMVTTLQAAQTAAAAPAASPAPVTQVAPMLAQGTPGAASAGTQPGIAQQPAQQVAVATPPKSKQWYEKLRLRGYTQMRLNEIVSGDATAPAGVSRLRTIGDSGVRADNNFSFRRMRLVLQGDLNDYVSILFPARLRGCGFEPVGRRAA